MNEIRGISTVAVHLAQAASPPGPLQDLLTQLTSAVPSLLYAIVILVIGWIVAVIAATVVKGVLKRTNLDNKLAGWITGQPEGAAVTNIEQWAAALVFWVIMIFVLIAFLNAIQLQVVSTPLNNFLNQVFTFLPRIAAAAVLLGVAWIIATLAKLLLTRGLQAFSLDDRLNQAGGGPGPTSGGGPGTPGGGSGGQQFMVSDTLGTALYWFIFLLFLPAIIGTLGLEGLLQPVQGLVDEILGYLPNALAAILVGVAGWFVARIVRMIVTNLLSATGIDRLGESFGLRQATGGRGLSWLIGYILFILILIPAVIAALNALQLPAVSGPATAMLQQILSSLPLIFTAALILIVAYFVGKIVGDLVSNILASVGFDNVFSWLGIRERPQGQPGGPPTPGGPSPSPTGLGGPSPGGPSPSPTGLGGPSPSGPSGLPTGPAGGPPIPGGPSTQPTRPGGPPTPGGPGGPSSPGAQSGGIERAAVQQRSPSEIVGIIILIGVMILAAVPAVSVLGFEELTTIVSGLLLVLGRVLVGLVIFGVGLFLANFVFKIIVDSGTSQARTLGQVARIAIIAVVAAMALQQMGIASSIVNLAFGLLLGAVAVAVALAFGLGSMDIAAEQVREWLTSFKGRGTPPPY